MGGVNEGDMVEGGAEEFAEEEGVHAFQAFRKFNVYSQRRFRFGRAMAPLKLSSLIRRGVSE